MIRNYIVSIDSDKFEVEVEENGEVKSDKVVVASAAAPVAPVAVPVAAPAAAPVAAAPAPVAEETAAPADGNKVESPLPGTLLRVIATKGTVVKENDLLCVIEAMKMENEIRTPYAGTVVSVAKNEGAMVNSGDLLFVIA